MPWEDFFAQLKRKVCDALFPAQPIVNDDSFGMTFSVPHHVTIPLDLTSAADYAHLFANISKIKTNPSAKVIIESCALNLVCIQFWLLLLMLKILQEPGKENLPNPAEGVALPVPADARAKKTGKTRV